MSLVDQLPPRAWTDVFVPTALTNVDWFDFYTEWLADYLFTSEIPLHPRQLEYASKISTLDPSSCIFEISDIYGYCIYELDGLENAYDAGEDWLAFSARERAYWEDDTNSMTRQELTYEEWAISHNTWYRCHEEWLESTQPIYQQEHIPKHADIPYRAFLALAIKRIPDRNIRIQTIRRFFINFSDNASK